MNMRKRRSRRTPRSTNRTQITLATAVLAITVAVAPTPATAQNAPPPTTSLMAQSMLNPIPQADSGERHLLLDTSMFAITPPEIREFLVHDLVQIIVRESSRTKSLARLETEKDYDLAGEISAWPNFQLDDLLEFQLFGGRTDDLPQVGVEFTKDFDGEGDYLRRDDLTMRLTAEVIEILPNGNLVLEARTYIQTDEETSEMRVTGICRPDDVTAANTLLSNQIHDLKIDKVHKGELRKATEKGILAKILDAVFAF